MATSVIVDGAALIQVATPAAGALEDLGYTMNGVEIRENIFAGDVYGDEFGGDQGPPIDVQYFGETHIISMLLTKYDEAVLNKIRAGIAAGTAGTPSTSGSLYFTASNNWRLLIKSTNRPRNYLHAIFKEPKEINKGTKHSKALVIATAYIVASSGVLYNATIV